jgi:hypothetical protein
MGEVTSFRLARAPQRVAPESGAGLVLSDTDAIQGWLLAGIDARGQAQEYLSASGLAKPARRFSTPNADAAAALGELRWFDQLLLARKNRVAWTEIAAAVQTRLDGQVARVLERQNWRLLRELLSSALVAILIGQGEAVIGGDVIRLLLVFGLLEKIVEAGALGAEQVFTLLRWRDVLLPESILDLPILGQSVLSRRPGVSDLYLVREEWARYELGEIAHIENVLKGELKRSLLEKTDEQETTVTTDTATTRTAQQDSQTTDRFELKLASQVDTSLALHVEGKVDTSGVYGPTTVNSHVGGSFDYSRQEADSRATTQARETVSRAASSIEESLRTQRIERTLTRTHTLDRHELNNVQGPDHTRGIYRWVDKIQTVQVFKYPHRLLYEFEVPEPGAFIRWLNGRPKTGALAPVIPFTLDGSEAGQALTSSALTWLDPLQGQINYLTLGRRYDVQGLKPPPANQFLFANIVLDQPDDDPKNNKPPEYKAAGSIVIPDKFEGLSFTIYATATDAGRGSRPTPTGWAEIIVGTDFPSLDATDSNPQQIWRWQGRSDFKDIKSMSFRQPVTGTVPILLITNDLSGMSATVQVVCQPTATALQQWRQDMFDLILTGYLSKQRQLADAAARDAIQAGIVIAGDSATRNAEVVREEIKRSTIELLIGMRFDGRNAVTEATIEAPPRTQFEGAALDGFVNTAKEIQFIEEAFEWENLSFVLYPYYWAAQRKWAELERISSPDADFDRFLQAGSARVVLPARPGFEAATQIYTVFGLVWGGGPAPAPDDDLYLSIADEIRAQQMAPKDGEPGESWEVRLPTTLVYLAPLETTLPFKNDHATLPMASGTDKNGTGTDEGDGPARPAGGGALIRRGGAQDARPVGGRVAKARAASTKKADKPKVGRTTSTTDA